MSYEDADLKTCCQEYVMWVNANALYIGDRMRDDIHTRMTELLKIDRDDEKLKNILWYLDKNVKLPLEKELFEEKDKTLYGARLLKLINKTFKVNIK